ncbi:hypothetical protein [Clostridium folliculivorans]|uniref:Uncharacterized protein n=1 Tax=Clostridium folliculivorans TaxID=2886038 RepID=A0A9W5XZY8_9CLOT|nr:hypothetical protein [Clostridium folliculivorans]GKU24189.1 hypothetical protein CFOLD11_10150 [Clostridium folliculivorans]GKU30294.1 hypothetical protein CFB3_24010 [Clostridium folliculivorans]
MVHNRLLTENTSLGPLVDELKNILHRLFIYTGSENNIDLSYYSTILVDFKDVVENSNEFALNKLINDALVLGKSLILLNVHNGKCLSKMIKVGFESKCMIIRSYDKYNVFNVLDLYESDIYDYGESHVTQSIDGSKNFNVQKVNDNEYSNSEIKDSFGELNVAKQARVIESILYSDFDIPPEFRNQSMNNTLAVLPENQFKLNYLIIENKWNLSEQQVANNSIVMEIALIASSNPNYKYLRIRSAGSGFNPSNGGEIENDSTYDKGYFQANIKIHMQPNTDKLKTLSTEPKNVQRQVQYTISNEFNVGVDLSQNPTFSKSYTISEPITAAVSDFNVYNKGTGIIADWDFNLQITENSIWDIFDQEFLNKSKVKPLPTSATRKLKAITEAIWCAENMLNETIGVQLYWKVDHYHCYVTGNWEDYTQHYGHRCRTVGYKDVPVYIDFSSVYA